MLSLTSSLPGSLIRKRTDNASEKLIPPNNDVSRVFCAGNTISPGIKLDMINALYLYTPLRAEREAEKIFIYNAEIEAIDKMNAVHSFKNSF